MHKNKIDKSILFVVIFLLGIGLVQVYSSSYIFAIESFSDGLFFLKKQLIFTIVGLLILSAVSYIPINLFRSTSYFIWLSVSALVVLTLVPSFGVKVGGASRWIPLLGNYNVEPSEFLKISLAIILSYYIYLHHHKKSKFSFKDWKWILRVLILLLPICLLLYQPDFGSFVLCLLVICTLLFMFGLHLRYVFLAILAVLPLFYFLVINNSYRKTRILSFLNPWDDPTRSGFQIIQSMLSFFSGGIFGKGLGQGQGKLFFLPEAHTDFTLAVMGEEWGFIGIFFLLLLFGFLIFRGFQIAINSRDVFAKALVLSIVVIFAYSVFINFGVTLGLLPTKGLTLPFLSYGGSSLISTCFSWGIVLSIARSENA